MKKILKGILALSVMGLFMTSCGDDPEDNGGGTPTTGSISNLDFTITTSGSGNIVSVLPSATGATSFSVDFGDDSTDIDDAVATSGPAVSHTYPQEDATYTITVTASNSSDSAVLSKDVEVEIVIAQTPVIGQWVLNHDDQALYLGSQAGEFWWASSSADVSGRDCLFDDVFEFHEDGTFTVTVGDSTWLEPGFNGVNEEECGTPQAPYDGSATATWLHDEANATLTLTGVGAYLGLQKVTDGNEIGSPSEAVSEIEYTQVAFSEDENTLTVEAWYTTADGAAAIWRFTLARVGTPGASLSQADTDNDGVIDALDACPDVAGTGDDGCPLLAMPQTGAPTPPTASGDVVASVFSDAYTQITVENFNPNWGQATVFSNETIDGNSTIVYSNLNYQGVEFGDGNAVDVTSATKVRFSYWTPNADSISFKIVNVDEPDGPTKELEVLKENLTLDAWGVLEFDLATDFGTVNKSAIRQLVFVSSVPQATFYIDDIYFY